MFCDVITAQEETQLVSFVHDQVAKGARRELAGNTYNKAKHMTAQLHYGVFYNIAENSLGGKTVEPIPEELNRFITKLTNQGILKTHQRPNTALVSVMEEGDGMLPHVDSKEFTRPICTLSLLADHEMLFGDKSGQIEAHGIGVYARASASVCARCTRRLGSYRIVPRVDARACFHVLPVRTQGQAPVAREFKCSLPTAAAMSS